MIYWRKKEDKIRTDPEKIDSPPKRRKYSKFTPEQKLLIIEEAKQSSNISAARNHGVAKSTMSNWRTIEDKIRTELPTISKMENEIFSWMINTRSLFYKQWFISNDFETSQFLK